MSSAQPYYAGLDDNCIANIMYVISNCQVFLERVFLLTGYVSLL